MTTYYLRCEAVNLYNSVYDTDDISTIRGGSHLLLDAIDALENRSQCEAADELKLISKGASTGLYQLLKAGSDEDAETIKQQVLICLRKIAHDSTFVVDYLEFSDSRDFQENLKHLMAKNRWAQFQQPTLILPGEDKTAEKACDIDWLRPGVKPEGNEMLSTFTVIRRDAGRKEKRRSLYVKKLGKSVGNLQFTNDLEELSSDKTRGVLDRKIAFIYLDGNKFGKIRDRYCNSAELLNQFDTVVQQDLRNAVLKELLEKAQNDTEFRNNDKIRLETLLWGGDEIEWVVPAWKGWEVLELFYSKAANFEDIPLTHSCGIVFCHHNAPIREIRRLAKEELARSTKNFITVHLSDGAVIPLTHEQGNYVQYLVLESFDSLAGSLEEFVQSYYHPAHLQDLLIKGGEIVALREHLSFIRRYFPHNKVYQIIQTLKQENDPVERTKGVNEIIKRALNEYPPARRQEILQHIQELVPEEQPGRWFIVADLWDYI